jgi:hypothetical protein
MMPRFFSAAVLSLALAGVGSTSFAADAVVKPPVVTNAPDVSKAALAWVQQITETEAPVCTIEEGSATSFSCTALLLATPVSFRCVVTETSTKDAGGTRCQVPLPPGSPDLLSPIPPTTPPGRVN